MHESRCVWPREYSREPLSFVTYLFDWVFGKPLYASFQQRRLSSRLDEVPKRGYLLATRVTGVHCASAQLLSLFGEPMLVEAAHRFHRAAYLVISL
jgi:hypothetical protein